MRWEDERYVRLYTRDSATWVMLPWQSRCLLPLILRKVDRAGVLDVVAGEEVTVIAELVKVPAELVAPGLAGLEKRGVVVISGGKLRMPAFLAAQEARQSDKIRQQKSRELAAITQGVSHAVTPSHTPSQDVTPSCAVPSRTVPKVPRAKKPREVDPRHAPLVFELVEIFREVTGVAYPFAANGGRNAKAVADLLAAEPVPERISTVWRQALRATGYPLVRTLPELATHFAHFIGAQPAKSSGLYVAPLDGERPSGLVDLSQFMPKDS